MQRIFVGLASVSVLLLLANVFLGLSGGDYNAAAHAYYEQGEQLRKLEAAGATTDDLAAATRRHEELREQAIELRPAMTRHMLLGILAALTTLFACSVSITYFVGTSRWFKEVAETYKLDSSYVELSQKTKRRSFRWSVIGALTILLVVGLGAASEPTWANAQHSRDYVLPHYLAALISFAVLMISFAAQYMSLSDNATLIESVMAEVRKIRQERGLAVEPEHVA